MPSHTKSMLEEAQASKEKSKETMSGPDDALNMLFDGMDVSALEDYSELGHLEVPKKTCHRERASVFHHESFLRSRLEIIQLEFELKEQVQKKDMYRALSEKQGEALKDFPILRDELEKVQEKIDLIDQLQDEMDEVMTMAEAMKGMMDLLALEKEAIKEELASVEDQLRVANGKADKWSRLNDELLAQLNSTVMEQDALGQEYTALKSKLEATLIDSS
ncbi:uncharacterized protein [Nicotiana sylvestris]|uniref:uncharacterized protein n=1 Tax=Nicotiana sylvestris TaxID=4096 RepID=UPI00388C692C